MLGTFLSAPAEVPEVVTRFMVEQLSGSIDPLCLKDYPDRLPTQHKHAREIRGGWGTETSPPPSWSCGPMWPRGYHDLSQPWGGQDPHHVGVDRGARAGWFAGVCHRPVGAKNFRESREAPTVGL